MKKIFIIIGIALLAFSLYAQTNMPRTLYVQARNSDNSPVAQTDQQFITFQATISSSPNTLTESSVGCGFTTLGGQTYLKIQLGNFTYQWQVGDIVTVHAQRSSDNATGSLNDIVIPEGTSAIYWGRGTGYPGTPLIFTAPTPATHIISGTIHSQWDLSGVTISATGIEPNNITYNAVTGDYTVTVPDNWIGDITPSKTDYIFIPPSRSYTDPVVADIPEQDFTMKTVVVPGVPTNLSPNGITLTYNEATPVVLSWDPVANAEGYKLIWNNNEAQDLQTNLTFTTPPLGAGTYTWKVCAYNNTATKKFNTPVRVQINSRSTSTTNSPKVDGGWAEASFEVVIVANTYTVQISSVPEGAAILVNNVDTGFVTPHTFEYNEGTNVGTITLALENYIWIPAEYVVDNLTGDLTLSFIGRLTFHNGEVVCIPGTSITIEIVDGSGVEPDIIPDFTPAINLSWVRRHVQFITLLGDGPWQININSPYPYVWVVGVGVFTGTFPMTITIPATRDRVTEIQFGEGGDPTLPVELSYFAATLTAENFVNIAWTTQTETNMNGFNIYRNDGSDNLASANRIAYIPATNTSTTQNYNLLDREVEIGHTYYYWLECVEISGHSTFNGPYPIYVNGPTPPVLPEYTKMHNAYPNPFRAGSGTTIAVEVKKGDSGTVTIYNILGQVVKTFSLTEGTNNLNWNGRDSKGNLCGNGIYFYKLSTNSLNQTKKMVIVK